MDERDKIIAELLVQIAELRAENAELRRRLGLNSHNSGKPPGSDGLAKKPAWQPKSLRESGKNPSGGRKGSKSTTLRQVDTPDCVVEHAPETCERCAEPLQSSPVVSVNKRQVFDIPPPKIEVTEHRALVKRCACGHDTAASFPSGVNSQTQYGERIKAYIVYLRTVDFIAEDRLQQTLKDLFGLDIATDTIAQAINSCAADLASERAEVLQTLQKSAVKHLDETGLRIAGKTSWLHVLCNDALTYYRVDAKRGAIFRDFSGGTIVHDHFKPYFTLKNVKHGMCNAHHLRELRAVAEFGSHAEGVWARGMGRLLRTVCRFVKVMHPLPRAAKNLFIRKVLLVYQRIIGKGEALYHSLPPLPAKRIGKPPKLTGHNLLLRLKCWRTATLRCLNGVTPFTNNQAEQDIRMMKVRQKISGGFRTFAGAEAFCAVRGFISTVKKQGCNVFSSLIARACVPSLF